MDRVPKTPEGWMTVVPEADEILDALGLECPQPVFRARECLDRMQARQVLEIRADDPLAELDLTVFCERFGHEFLGSTDSGDHRRFRIRKGAGRFGR